MKNEKNKKIISAIIFVLSVFVIIGCVIYITDLRKKAAELERKSSKEMIEYSLEDGVLTIYGQGEMPGNMKFTEREDIKRVIFKNGITCVVDEAFMNCPNIEKVVFCDSINKIGVSSFEGCTNLKTVRFGTGELIVGDKAFYGCEKLRDVNFDDELTKVKLISIGEYAFAHTNLFNVYVEYAREIGRGAFVSENPLNSISVAGNTKYMKKMYMYPDNSSAEVVHLSSEEDETDCMIYSKNVKFSADLDLSITAYIDTEEYEVSINSNYYSSYKGVIYDKYGMVVLAIPNKKKIKIKEGCKIFDVAGIFINNEDDSKWIYTNVKEIEFPKSFEVFFGDGDVLDVYGSLSKNCSLEKLTILNNDIEKSEIEKVKTWMGKELNATAERNVTFSDGTFILERE